MYVYKYKCTFQLDVFIMYFHRNKLNSKALAFLSRNNGLERWKKNSLLLTVLKPVKAILLNYKVNTSAVN